LDPRRLSKHRFESAQRSKMGVDKPIIRCYIIFRFD
jgi:hypothetical protein